MAPPHRGVVETKGDNTQKTSGAQHVLKQVSVADTALGVLRDAILHSIWVGNWISKSLLAERRQISSFSFMNANYFMKDGDSSACLTGNLGQGNEMTLIMWLTL